MHPRPNSPPPPWNEVLRACASRELHPCAFGAHIDLVTDRLEPRSIRLVLRSGERSLDLTPAYACPCGSMSLGTEDAVVIDDLATATGAASHVDMLVTALRSLRAELAPAPQAPLRTIAAAMHVALLCKLCIHATRWNLPPYDSLGRSRARPSKCWHVK